MANPDPDPVPVRGPHLGRIDSYDRRRGLGVVRDADGAAYDFHATAIADGTRTIDPGTDVTFVLAPGHRGRYEARVLVALDSHQRPA